MSLLDKQEVQDICEHTALRARKWKDIYVNELQKIRHYRARSTEEEDEKKKEECQIAIFFTSRGAYVNCAIIAMLYTHSIGNQP